jgi:XTP/dITP diphosphohydrolase
MIYFLTSNTYKFEQLSRIIDCSVFGIEQKSDESIEIQSVDTDEVAGFASYYAANSYGTPVIKEDVGLYIDGLNGFPGPFLKFAESQLDFLELIKNLKNDQLHAVWKYSVALCFPGEAPTVFCTHQHGTLVKERRGENGSDTDKLFVPQHTSLTISELLDREEYHRMSEHYVLLKKYLETRFESHQE